MLLTGAKSTVQRVEHLLCGVIFHQGRTAVPFKEDNSPDLQQPPPALLSKLMHTAHEKIAHFFKTLNSSQHWAPTCKKMNLDPLITPYTKRNSKWIRNQNVSPRTIKLLEENVDLNLHDLGLGSGF